MRDEGIDLTHGEIRPAMYYDTYTKEGSTITVMEDNTEESRKQKEHEKQEVADHSEGGGRGGGRGLTQKAACKR